MNLKESGEGYMEEPKGREKEKVVIKLQTKKINK